MCSHAWWRVILLIDNWYSDSCYSALWFVQAEIQYSLVISLLFLVYFSSRKAAYYLLGFVYIGCYVGLVSVLSADMPVSFNVALQKYTQ